MGRPCLRSQLDKSRFEILKKWKQEYNMEQILVGIKKEMMSSANRKLPQPGEGDMF